MWHRAYQPFCVEFCAYLFQIMCTLVLNTLLVLCLRFLIAFLSSCFCRACTPTPHTCDFLQYINFMSRTQCFILSQHGLRVAVRGPSPTCGELWGLPPIPWSNSNLLLREAVESGHWCHFSSHSFVFKELKFAVWSLNTWKQIVEILISLPCKHREVRTIPISLKLDTLTHKSSLPTTKSASISVHWTWQSCMAPIPNPFGAAISVNKSRNQKLWAGSSLQWMDKNKLIVQCNIYTLWIHGSTSENVCVCVWATAWQ